MEEGSTVYVYFHCISKNSTQVWYRVKFDKEEEEAENQIIQLNPVAKLPFPLFNNIDPMRGDWTVVGNDIYHIGGYYKRDYIVSSILKHTLPDDDDRDHSHSGLDDWKTEGSKPPFVHWEPFFAADAANKKLYVVGGRTIFCKPDHHTPGGIVYDLVTKTWTCLQDVHISEVSSYDTDYQVSVVLNDDEARPMEIVFYDISDGTIRFLNLAEEGGKLFDCAVHDQFNLRPPCEFAPPSSPDLTFADHPGCVPALVIDRTFYWFNIDMCLYGYDSKAKTWIKSQCLKKHFHKPYYQTHYFRMPYLLGQSKSKMLVILSTSEKEFTVTSLHVDVVVDKTVTKLGVSVEKTLSYCFDDPYVSFMGAKSMICNHRASSERMC